jgi:hypothetical protein
MSTNQKLWPSEMAASRKLETARRLRMPSDHQLRILTFLLVVLLVVGVLVGPWVSALDVLFSQLQTLMEGLQPTQLVSTAGK